MELGKVIKNLRLNQRISQTDFARSVKITQSYLSQLENNPKKLPSMHTLERIALGLGTPVPVIMALSLTENDVSKSKQSMYQVLFPHIQNMLIQLSRYSLL